MANALLIKVCDAPESNNITIGCLAIENIPIITGSPLESLLPEHNELDLPLKQLCPSDYSDVDYSAVGSLGVSEH